ncbi:hypothetical protein [uncultured Algimonas sp.]|uniref:hypothetical protein n=1 Tax=uncultured Algimonas sp. TaxID=1547920 RepID=UPI00260183E1|nr:hypothetical protein [uncultured Algimonas sp.]
MKKLSYTLEICGWFLIAFTLIWAFGNMITTMNISMSTTEPTVWDRLVRLGSLFGYVLEGLILGLVAIIIARLARHPNASSLSAMAVRMIRSAREVTGKVDD